MIKSEILVPLLNANEPEARLVGIHVEDGQTVEKGALLFTLETTKAASDVVSPETGFIRIFVKEGDTLSVGDILAYVTDTVDEPLPQPSEFHPSSFTLHPSSFALIHLDGADTSLAHFIGEADFDALRIGQRVSAVFAGTRRGSILDIAYFQPT